MAALDHETDPENLQSADVLRALCDSYFRPREKPRVPAPARELARRRDQDVSAAAREILEEGVAVRVREAERRATAPLPRADPRKADSAVPVVPVPAEPPAAVAPVAPTHMDTADAGLVAAAPERAHKMHFAGAHRVSNGHDSVASSPPTERHRGDREYSD